jgi:hypothetical protein
MTTTPITPERTRYAVYDGQTHMSDWASRKGAEQSVESLAYLNRPLEIVELREASTLAARAEAYEKALKYYAAEGTYGITCAMHDGVPSEVPHLVIEEDGGKIARTALASQGASR